MKVVVVVRCPLDRAIVQQLKDGPRPTSRAYEARVNAHPTASELVPPRGPAAQRHGLSGYRVDKKSRYQPSILAVTIAPHFGAHVQTYTSCGAITQTLSN